MAEPRSNPDATPTDASAGGPPTGGEPLLQADLSAPQLTARALLTGCLLGAVLSSCNIYTGLTIGWGFNMSITAILLSYGFWLVLQSRMGTRPWGMLENNISQVACSSAAAVSSAGLVAPIPALTMMTGEQLSWFPLSVWVFSVCMVGITCAIPIRRQMLEVDKLPFPSGLANATMLKEMYAHGAEAVARVIMMMSAIAISAALALFREFPILLQTLLLPLHWIAGVDTTGWRLARIGLPIPTAWIGGFPAGSLTFSFDPSLMMIGVGGLIGMRACLSLVGGAVLGWLVLAPVLIHGGQIRLRVAEPLPLLPAEVVGQLPREPLGYTSYDADKRALTHRGVMTAAERDRLLGLSEDARWRSVIEMLHTRSQLRLAAPLAALPEGVSLAGRPLRFDAGRGELRMTGAMDASTLSDLRAASADAQWQSALQSLSGWIDYDVVRPVIHAVALERRPVAYQIPREFGHVLRIDLGKRQLLALGRVDDAVRDGVLADLEADLRGNPALRDDAAMLREAIPRLAELSNRPLLAVEATSTVRADGIIELLSGRVVYDSRRRVFQTRGLLGAADETALAELPLAIDETSAEEKATAEALRASLKATASSLRAGGQVVAAAPGFTDVVEWLLWPGVTLMVVSSLVSFSFSWPAMLRSLRFTGRRREGDESGEGNGNGGADAAAAAVRRSLEVPWSWFFVMFVGSLILAVACQTMYYGIVWWAAVLGVLLSFVLAVVAARVSGETNNTPVGAMGKVTQLVFGALQPASPAANLMTANITGGAASQCADLMHDLKTGHLIGAAPRRLTVAQIFGALAGALAGSFFYLVLVPNPTEQLFTEKWPAPAVATWRAVAELFRSGMDALPEGTLLAMMIAGGLGVALPLAGRYLPPRLAFFVPSSAALGLAFVINAFNCLSMFIGGLLALLLSWFLPKWTARFLVALCAGLTAGEPLSGVGISLSRMPFMETLWEFVWGL